MFISPGKQVNRADKGGSSGDVAEPMARKVRIEYSGAVYHVMARANQGRPVFADDPNRKQWLQTLAEAYEKTGWRIHSYMPYLDLEGRVLELGRRAGREELNRQWRQIRWGWYLGGEGFRGRLLKALKPAPARGRAGSYSGEAKREHGEAEARRLAAAGMAALGLEARELQRRPKNLPEKQAPAWWLRQRTTVGRR